MKKLSLALSALAISLIAQTLTASNSQSHDADDEGLDAAQAIINLAPSIVNQLNAPSVGSERTVTKATITDQENTRIYYIEGEDVNHKGHVLSTYWLKLYKSISFVNGMMTVNYTVSRSSTPMPMAGRLLSDESQKLIGQLLNGVYDIADLDLDHQRVELNSVTAKSEDPLVYEIIGINNICPHTELNTFNITIARHLEGTRAHYDTHLVMPYKASNPEDGVGEDIPETMNAQ